MDKTRKIGLYFGSFNPIHIGHLAIANIIQQKANLDQVWLMVSPQNPLKEVKGLLPFKHRYEMTKLALSEANNLVAKDIESELDIPSYTIQTLNYLQQEYPECQFSIIMGGDNLAVIKYWKAYQTILDEYDVLAYNRPGAIIEDEFASKVTLVDAPKMEISSSYIREMLSKGFEVKYLMPHGVYEYIVDHELIDLF